MLEAQRIGWRTGSGLDRRTFLRGTDLRVLSARPLRLFHVAERCGRL